MSSKSTSDAQIFYADTRFERMGRRPGGKGRDEALADAQAEIDRLQPEFAEWLSHEVQTLAATLAQVEGGSGDKTLLDQAIRICAQLRDTGATFGFEFATFIAKNLCDILEVVKAGAAYDKDVIDCHVDALFLARSSTYRHLRPDQVPEITAGLRRVLKLAIDTSPRTGE